MKKLFFGFFVFSVSFFVACSSSKDGVAKIPPNNNPNQFLTLEDRLLKAPGVFIQNGQVRIRGGDQSFFGDSEPLFEINGQVVSGGYASVRNMVGPMDIRSIRVLKNPDELVMYGVRGSNGVIKIRLKNAAGEN